MHLILALLRLFLVMGIVSAYPLRRICSGTGVQCRQIDTDNVSTSVHFPSLPLSVVQGQIYALNGDNTLAGISSREFATSFATTLIGGGLALILT